MTGVGMTGHCIALGNAQPQFFEEGQATLLYLGDMLPLCLLLFMVNFTIALKPHFQGNSDVNQLKIN
jgi:hypothetical protein